jgi:hypothetical protein
MLKPRYALPNYPLCLEVWLYLQQAMKWSVNDSRQRQAP